MIYLKSQKNVFQDISFSQQKNLKTKSFIIELSKKMRFKMDEDDMLFDENEDDELEIDALELDA